MLDYSVTLLAVCCAGLTQCVRVGGRYVWTLNMLNPHLAERAEALTTITALQAQLDQASLPR